MNAKNKQINEYWEKSLMNAKNNHQYYDQAN